MTKTTVTINGEEKTFKSKKRMLKVIGRAILQSSDQRMTLRQLYYRFVAQDFIENKQSQYQYLGDAIKEARLEGVIDWDSIEDRTRSTDAGDHNSGDYVAPEDRFKQNLEWFKNTPERFYRPRWEGQPKYVEVWVEKEALAGVFGSVCRDMNVVSFPNRGYTSITLLKQAADRITNELNRSHEGTGDREAHILYFGDFDPSGQDIERNIREKLWGAFDVDVTVERVALTRAQIDKFELPPQPAKRTDARYESFVKEHGDMAVELDALPPSELEKMIRESVDEYFDRDIYENHVKPQQEKEREWLREKIQNTLSDTDLE